MKRISRLTLVSLVAAGCATVPPVESPALDLAIPDRWTAAKSLEPDLAPDWWTAFGDPELDRTVQTALEQNRDLRAAAARLEQAAGDARIAGSALRPTVETSFNGSRRRQNFIGFPIPGREDTVLSTIATNLGVSVETSWEIDLWDRLRSGARAALADLQAAAAQYRGAQLSIAGQTTKAWLAIAETQQQMELAAATVESFRAASDQVRDRFEQGLRSSLDLRLALSNLASAEALAAERRRQLDAAVRQLELLLGRYASRQIAPPGRLPDAPAAIPAGLPADLVSRRPDLVAAERALAAAGERVQVARGDLYPRLSLTAATGTASNELQDLINGDFSVWSLVTNLTQPVFQGGRLRAGVDRAEGRADEALAAYASAALRAYAEVETALAADQFLADRARHLSDAADQARAARALAEDRYRAGLEDFITVLEAQRRALEAEGALLAARRLRLDNRVDLYLALGGGFHHLEAPIQLELAGAPGEARLK